MRGPACCPPIAAPVAMGGDTHTRDQPCAPGSTNEAHGPTSGTRRTAAAVPAHGPAHIRSTHGTGARPYPKPHLHRRPRQGPLLSGQARPGRQHTPSLAVTAALAASLGRPHRHTTRAAHGSRTQIMSRDSRPPHHRPGRSLPPRLPLFSGGEGLPAARDQRQQLSTSRRVSSTDCLC